MERKRDLGRAEPVKMHILPDLAFDYAEDKPLPPKLGKADVPLIVLPDLVFDSCDGQFRCPDQAFGE